MQGLERKKSSNIQIFFPKYVLSDCPSLIFFRGVETAKTYPFTCHVAPHTYMSHFPTVESWALHSPFSDQKARGPEDVSIGGLWKES